MSRKDIIDLKFFPKLLSLKLAGFRDLDHDARMDLIDERDGSFPDTVHTRKLLLDSHNKEKLQQVGREGEKIVVVHLREVSKEKKGKARGRLDNYINNYSVLKVQRRRISLSTLWLPPS
jgi:hypothetical protein